MPSNLDQQERPGFVPVSTYLSLKHAPNTWVIENLLPASGTAILYGLPKTGKTSCIIQLACALSGGADDWLGFPIHTHGPVLFLELDTPRSTFRLRFKALDKHGIKYNNDNLLLADRESLAHFPFDISKIIPHDHMLYLHSIVQPIKPTVVVVDTLRKVHSGDEDNSTNMSNVVSRLIGAVHPAALILISHSRKPNQEGTFDLMSDHRGSGSVVGEMDCVMKLTRSKLYYGGRNIEEGHLSLDRLDTDGVLLWKVKEEVDVEIPLKKVMEDTTLVSMRAKARVLAPLVGKNIEACMSIVRRAVATHKHQVPVVEDAKIEKA